MSSLWLLLGLGATCGALPLRARGERRLQYAMTDSNIETAVDAWLADATAAEAIYGHISTWDTSGVTDMSWLFYDTHVWVQESAGCTGACLFNDDISAWDTSGVKKMHSMFYGAASFNRNI